LLDAQVPDSLSPKGRILVVDDVQEVVDLLSAVLTFSGYEVSTVSDGAETVDAVRHSMPDLILLDVRLSGFDGYTICQKLKSHPQTQNIPIIFISAQDQVLDKIRAFEVGGVDYIVKPFSLQEVIARVENQLTIRNLQKKLLEQQAHRLLQARGTTPLLASLQKHLHQQSEMLKEKNRQLEQEVRDRQQAQEALKIEQEKSEQLLLNILPRAIAQRLKEEQGVLAERFDEVTILFADIVDFTPLSARLSPMALVQLLNQIFSTFDRLAEEHGLEKIKTIGDAYMVAGGVPMPRADHAEAVMEMAIAMRREIKQFTQDNGKAVQLRIGINTGPVVAGVIGISKFSYDLWGDAVNIASRMESQGLAGKIQVTEETYQRLRHQYVFEKWGAINVKGKGKMMTYLLVRRKTD
jgi:class 3 adenylate cyclase/ActR/RegA family two-component response regulator